jgi:hypothetical protein
LYSYSVFSAVFAIFVWRNQKAPFFCIFKKTKGLLRTTERMKLQIATVSRVMSQNRKKVTVCSMADENSAHDESRSIGDACGGSVNPSKDDSITVTATPL